MMKPVSHFYPLLVLLACIQPAAAQSGNRALAPLSLRCSAYGSKPKADAAIGFPAVLGTVRQSTLSAFSEQRFLPAALSYSSLAMLLPAGSGAFGGALLFSGFDSYRNNGFYGSYGRKLGKDLQLGIGFQYDQVRIKGYEKTGWITIEASMMVRLAAKLKAGLQASGQVVHSGSAPGSGVKQTYFLGIGYEVSAQLLLVMETLVSTGIPPSVDAGLQYQPLPGILLRSGISSGRKIFYAGASFEKNKWCSSLTLSVHPQLGISPSLGIIYNIKTEDQ